MRLSKRTEYGLRAIVQLAKLWPTQYVLSRDLSKREDLPNKFLEAILLALRRGGFLESKVGAGGGYKLSKSPREIIVGDVIRRLEGRLSIHDTEKPTGATAGDLAAHLINTRLTKATDTVLDKMTLEELIEEVNKLSGSQQEMYYI